MPAVRRNKKTASGDTTGTSCDAAAAAGGDCGSAVAAAQQTTDRILESMNALEKQIEEWFKSLHAAKGTLRTSKKEYLKELRANRAIQRGGKASASASSGAALSTEPKKASSFTKEVPISDALADFMGLPHGSTPKRNEAVTFVMNYMKQNGLTVGRKINPDAALKALLGDLRPNHTEFHYFNLQTYLSRHFGKAAINSGLISGQTASAPAATVA